MKPEECSRLAPGTLIRNRKGLPNREGLFMKREEVVPKGSTGIVIKAGCSKGHGDHVLAYWEVDGETVEALAYNFEIDLLAEEYMAFNPFNPQ